MTDPGTIRRSARTRRRLSALAIILLAALSGTALFWTAQRVQTGEARLRTLQNSATDEQESMRVLRAEWDYLNRPDRLEALARKDLNMVPPRAGAVAGSPAALQEPKPENPAAAKSPVKISPPEAGSPSAGGPEKVVPKSPPPSSGTSPAEQKSFHDLLDSVTRDNAKEAR